MKTKIFLIFSKTWLYHWCYGANVRGNFIWADESHTKVKFQKVPNGDLWISRYYARKCHTPSDAPLKYLDPISGRTIKDML